MNYHICDIFVVLTTKQEKHKLKPPKTLLILVLLLEGAAVMFSELAMARMIAPYYGASLTTWAAVIGVTMSSLAFGYLLGGKIADRTSNHFNILMHLLFGCAITLLLMPYLGNSLMFRFIGFSTELNVVLLSFAVLSPSLILFGTLPQIVTRLFLKTADDAGRIVGLAYAISTLGGIAGTFICGFIIIPAYGITVPLIVTSIILLLLPFYFLLLKQQKWIILFYIPLLFLVIKKQQLQSSYKDSTGIKVLKYDEGLLGQLLVADYPYLDKNGQFRYNRMLMINRMAESTIDPQTNEIIFGEYIHIMMKALDPVPDNSKVLLLGLGAGNLVKQFQKRKFQLDVCELDERIGDVAFEYFGLQNDFNLKIDDARHYLNTSKSQYDLIVFDVFKGENPPAYLLSRENLNHVRSLLSPEGVIAINFNGFLTGDIGKSGRSVIKTALSCDYHVDLFASKGQEQDRNSVMILSESGLDYSSYQNSQTYGELYNGQLISDIRDYKIPISTIDTADAFILKDDAPILDIINKEAAANWRYHYNKFYTSNFIKQGIPMFN